MTTSIVAIDPGMTYLGVAYFHLLTPQEVGDPRAIARSYHGSDRVELAKQLPPKQWTKLATEERLLLLAQIARGLILGAGGTIDGSTLVGIERPAYAGTLSRHNRHQRTKQSPLAGSLELLNFSIGALVVAADATGARVQLVRAFAESKQERLQVVRGYWPARFRALSEPNDESDATYLGLVLATNGGLRKETTRGARRAAPT